MHDLVIELQDKLKMINKAIDKLARNGQSLAESEMHYRIELAKMMLEERSKGTPVTCLGDICRGNPKIAALKFTRDTAQAVYDANQEAINAWKLECRIMESQLAREWGRTD